MPDHLLRVLRLVAVLLAFLSSSQPSSPSPSADLLLLHAHIITMDSARPAAQAIAIHAGRFAWVGSDNEARTRFPATHTLDLQGATVLPGIIDAHTHLIELGKSLLRLNLKDVATEKEVVERVKQKVASTAPNEWILGWGWDEGKWASDYPTNQALDGVSRTTPFTWSAFTLSPPGPTHAPCNWQASPRTQKIQKTERFSAMSKPASPLASC